MEFVSQQAKKLVQLLDSSEAQERDYWLRRTRKVIILWLLTFLLMSMVVVFLIFGLDERGKYIDYTLHYIQQGDNVNTEGEEESISGEEDRKASIYENVGNIELPKDEYTEGYKFNNKYYNSGNYEVPIDPQSNLANSLTSDKGIYLEYDLQYYRINIKTDTEAQVKDDGYFTTGESKDGDTLNGRVIAYNQVLNVAPGQPLGFNYNTLFDSNFKEDYKNCQRVEYDDKNENSKIYKFAYDYMKLNNQMNLVGEVEGFFATNRDIYSLFHLSNAEIDGLTIEENKKIIIEDYDKLIIQDYDGKSSYHISGFHYTYKNQTIYYTIKEVEVMLDSLSEIEEDDFEDDYKNTYLVTRTIKDRNGNIIPVKDENGNYVNELFTFSNGLDVVLGLDGEPKEAGTSPSGVKVLYTTGKRVSNEYNVNLFTMPGKDLDIYLDWDRDEKYLIAIDVIDDYTWKSVYGSTFAFAPKVDISDDGYADYENFLSYIKYIGVNKNRYYNQVSSLVTTALTDGELNDWDSLYDDFSEYSESDWAKASVIRNVSSGENIEKILEGNLKYGETLQSWTDSTGTTRYYIPIAKSGYNNGNITVSNPVGNWEVYSNVNGKWGWYNINDERVKDIGNNHSDSCILVRPMWEADKFTATFTLSDGSAYGSDSDFIRNSKNERMYNASADKSLKLLTEVKTDEGNLYVKRDGYRLVGWQIDADFYFNFSAGLKGDNNYVDLNLNTRIDQNGATHPVNKIFVDSMNFTFKGTDVREYMFEKVSPNCENLYVYHHTLNEDLGEGLYYDFYYFVDNNKGYIEFPIGYYTPSKTITATAVWQVINYTATIDFNIIDKETQVAEIDQILVADWNDDWNQSLKTAYYLGFGNIYGLAYKQIDENTITGYKPFVDADGNGKVWSEYEGEYAFEFNNTDIDKVLTSSIIRDDVINLGASITIPYSVEKALYLPNQKEIYRLGYNLKGYTIYYTDENGEDVELHIDFEDGVLENIAISDTSKGFDKTTYVIEDVFTELLIVPNWENIVVNINGYDGTDPYTQQVKTQMDYNKIKEGSFDKKTETGQIVKPEESTQWEESYIMYYKNLEGKNNVIYDSDPDTNIKFRFDNYANNTTEFDGNSAEIYIRLYDYFYNSSFRVNFTFNDNGVERELSITRTTLFNILDANSSYYKQSKPEDNITYTGSFETKIYPTADFSNYYFTSVNGVDIPEDKRPALLTVKIERVGEEEGWYKFTFTDVIMDFRFELSQINYVMVQNSFMTNDHQYSKDAINYSLDRLDEYMDDYRLNGISNKTFIPDSWYIIKEYDELNDILDYNKYHEDKIEVIMVSYNCTIIAYNALEMTSDFDFDAFNEKWNKHLTDENYDIYSDTTSAGDSTGYTWAEHALYLKGGNVPKGVSVNTYTSGGDIYIQKMNGGENVFVKELCCIDSYLKIIFTMEPMVQSVISSSVTDQYGVRYYVDKKAPYYQQINMKDIFDIDDMPYNVKYVTSSMYPGGIILGSTGNKRLDIRNYFSSYAYRYSTYFDKDGNFVWLEDSNYIQQTVNLDGIQYFYSSVYPINSPAPYSNYSMEISFRDASQEYLYWLGRNQIEDGYGLVDQYALEIEETEDGKDYILLEAREDAINFKSVGKKTYTILDKSVKTDLYSGEYANLYFSSNGRAYNRYVYGFHNLVDTYINKMGYMSSATISENKEKIDDEDIDIVVAGTKGSENLINYVYGRTNNLDASNYIYYKLYQDAEKAGTVNYTPAVTKWTFDSKDSKTSIVSMKQNAKVFDTYVESNYPNLYTMLMKYNWISGQTNNVINFSKYNGATSSSLNGSINIHSTERIIVEYNFTGRYGKINDYLYDHSKPLQDRVNYLANIFNGLLSKDTADIYSILTVNTGEKDKNDNAIYKFYISINPSYVKYADSVLNYGNNGISLYPSPIKGDMSDYLQQMTLYLQNSNSFDVEGTTYTYGGFTKPADASVAYGAMQNGALTSIAYTLSQLGSVDTVDSKEKFKISDVSYGLAVKEMKLDISDDFSKSVPKFDISVGTYGNVIIDISSKTNSELEAGVKYYITKQEDTWDQNFNQITYKGLYAQFDDPGKDKVLSISVRIDKNDKSIYYLIFADVEDNYTLKIDNLARNSSQFVISGYKDEVVDGETVYTDLQNLTDITAYVLANKNVYAKDVYMYSILANRLIDVKYDTTSKLITVTNTLIGGETRNFDITLDVDLTNITDSSLRSLIVNSVLTSKDFLYITDGDAIASSFILNVTKVDNGTETNIGSIITNGNLDLNISINNDALSGSINKVNNVNADLFVTGKIFKLDGVKNNSITNLTSSSLVLKSDKIDYYSVANGIGTITIVAKDDTVANLVINAQPRQMTLSPFVNSSMGYYGEYFYDVTDDANFIIVKAKDVEDSGITLNYYNNLPEGGNPYHDSFIANLDSIYRSDIKSIENTATKMQNNVYYGDYIIVKHAYYEGYSTSANLAVHSKGERIFSFDEASETSNNLGYLYTDKTSETSYRIIYWIIRIQTETSSEDNNGNDIYLGLRSKIKQSSLTFTGTKVSENIGVNITTSHNNDNKDINKLEYGADETKKLSSYIYYYNSNHPLNSAKNSNYKTTTIKLTIPKSYSQTPFRFKIATGSSAQTVATIEREQVNGITTNNVFVSSEDNTVTKQYTYANSNVTIDTSTAITYDINGNAIVTILLHEVKQSITFSLMPDLSDEWKENKYNISIDKDSYSEYTNLSNSKVQIFQNSTELDSDAYSNLSYLTEGINIVVALPQGYEKSNFTVKIEILDNTRVFTNNENIKYYYRGYIDDLVNINIDFYEYSEYISLISETFEGISIALKPIMANYVVSLIPGKVEDEEKKDISLNTWEIEVLDNGSTFEATDLPTTAITEDINTTEIFNVTLNIGSSISESTGIKFNFNGLRSGKNELVMTVDDYNNANPVEKTINISEREITFRITPTGAGTTVSFKVEIVGILEDYDISISGIEAITYNITINNLNNYSNYFESIDYYYADNASNTTSLIGTNGKLTPNMASRLHIIFDLKNDYSLKLSDFLSYLLNLTDTDAKNNYLDADFEYDTSTTESIRYFLYSASSKYTAIDGTTYILGVYDKKFEIYLNNINNSLTLDFTDFVVKTELDELYSVKLTTKDYENNAFNIFSDIYGNANSTNIKFEILGNFRDTSYGYLISYSPEYELSSFTFIYTLTNLKGETVTVAGANKTTGVDTEDRMLTADNPLYIRNDVEYNLLRVYVYSDLYANIDLTISGFEVKYHTITVDSSSDNQMFTYVNTLSTDNKTLRRDASYEVDGATYQNVYYIELTSDKEFVNINGVYCLPHNAKLTITKGARDFISVISGAKEITINATDYTYGNNLSLENYIKYSGDNVEIVNLVIKTMYTVTTHTLTIKNPTADSQKPVIEFTLAGTTTYITSTGTKTFDFNYGSNISLIFKVPHYSIISYATSVDGTYTLNTGVIKLNNVSQSYTTSKVETDSNNITWVVWEISYNQNVSNLTIEFGDMNQVDKFNYQFNYFDSCIITSAFEDTGDYEYKASIKYTPASNKEGYVILGDIYISAVDMDGNNYALTISGSNGLYTTIITYGTKVTSRIELNDASSQNLDYEFNNSTIWNKNITNKTFTNVSEEITFHTESEYIILYPNRYKVSFENELIYVDSTMYCDADLNYNDNYNLDSFRLDNTIDHYYVMHGTHNFYLGFTPSSLDFDDMDNLCSDVIKLNEVEVGDQFYNPDEYASMTVNCEYKFVVNTIPERYTLTINTGFTEDGHISAKNIAYILSGLNIEGLTFYSGENREDEVVNYTDGKFTLTQATTTLYYSYPDVANLKIDISVVYSNYEFNKGKIVFTKSETSSVGESKTYYSNKWSDNTMKDIYIYDGGTIKLNDASAIVDYLTYINKDATISNLKLSGLEVVNTNWSAMTADGISTSTVAFTGAEGYKKENDSVETEKTFKITISGTDFIDAENSNNYSAYIMFKYIYATSTLQYSINGANYVSMSTDTSILYSFDIVMTNSADGSTSTNKIYFYGFEFVPNGETVINIGFRHQFRDTGDIASLTFGEISLNKYNIKTGYIVKDDKENEYTLFENIEGLTLNGDFYTGTYTYNDLVTLKFTIGDHFNQLQSIAFKKIIDGTSYWFNISYNGSTTSFNLQKSNTIDQIFEDVTSDDKYYNTLFGSEIIDISYDTENSVLTLKFIIKNDLSLNSRGGRRNIYNISTSYQYSETDETGTFKDLADNKNAYVYNGKENVEVEVIGNITIPEDILYNEEATVVICETNYFEIYKFVIGLDEIIIDDSLSSFNDSITTSSGYKVTVTAINDKAKEFTITLTILDNIDIKVYSIRREVNVNIYYISQNEEVFNTCYTSVDVYYGYSVEGITISGTIPGLDIAGVLKFGVYDDYYGSVYEDTYGSTVVYNWEIITNETNLFASGNSNLLVKDSVDGFVDSSADDLLADYLTDSGNYYSVYTRTVIPVSINFVKYRSIENLEIEDESVNYRAGDDLLNLKVEGTSLTLSNHINQVLANNPLLINNEKYYYNYSYGTDSTEEISLIELPISTNASNWLEFVLASDTLNYASMYVVLEDKPIEVTFSSDYEINAYDIFVGEKSVYHFEGDDQDYYLVKSGNYIYGIIDNVLKVFKDTGETTEEGCVIVNLIENPTLPILTKLKFKTGFDNGTKKVSGFINGANTYNGDNYLCVGESIVFDTTTDSSKAKVCYTVEWVENLVIEYQIEYEGTIISINTNSTNMLDPYNVAYKYYTDNKNNPLVSSVLIESLYNLSKQPTEDLGSYYNKIYTVVGVYYLNGANNYVAMGSGDYTIELDYSTGNYVKVLATSNTSNTIAKVEFRLMDKRGESEDSPILIGGYEVLGENPIWNNILINNNTFDNSLYFYQTGNFELTESIYGEVVGGDLKLSTLDEVDKFYGHYKSNFNGNLVQDVLNASDSDPSNDKYIFAQDISEGDEAVIIDGTSYENINYIDIGYDSSNTNTIRPLFNSLDNYATVEGVYITSLGATNAVLKSSTLTSITYKVQSDLFAMFGVTRVTNEELGASTIATKITNCAIGSIVKTSDIIDRFTDEEEMDDRVGLQYLSVIDFKHTPTSSSNIKASYIAGIYFGPADITNCENGINIIVESNYRSYSVGVNIDLFSSKNNGASDIPVTDPNAYVNFDDANNISTISNCINYGIIEAGRSLDFANETTYDFEWSVGVSYGASKVIDSINYGSTAIGVAVYAKEVTNCENYGNTYEAVASRSKNVKNCKNFGYTDVGIARLSDVVDRCYNYGSAQEVGIAEKCNVVSNCINYVDMNESGITYMAGIAYNCREVINCTNEGNISGTNISLLAGIAVSDPSDYYYTDIFDYAEEEGVKSAEYYTTTKIENCNNLGAISANSPNTAKVAGILVNSCILEISFSIAEFSTVTNCNNEIDDIDEDEEIISGEDVNALGGIVAGQYINVTNCINNYPISAIDVDQVGGISAGSFISVEDCINNGEIVVNNNSVNVSVGGISARSNLNIINCDNFGNINSTNRTGTSNIGGIVGHISGGNMVQCSNKAELLKLTVNSTLYGIYVGGILGMGMSNDSNIEINNCYSVSDISVTNNVYGATPCAGGLIGALCDSSIYHYELLDSYTTGSVNVISGSNTSTSCAGGLIGYAWNANNSLTDIVENCYASGSVSTTSVGSALICQYGGYELPSIKSCYVSNESNVSAGTIYPSISGITNSTKEEIWTFATLNWDPSIWAFPDGTDPVFRDDPNAFAGYTEISSRAQLEAITSGASTSVAKYVLTQDIDLSGEEWTPLSDIEYIILEGNGKKINNMTITSNIKFSGLFGSGIKNSKFVDVDLKEYLIENSASSTSNRSGSIAATVNNCSFYYCDSIGVNNLKTIGQYSPYVGGLVGYSTDCLFKNCSTGGSLTCEVSVTGSDTEVIYLGGVVGYFLRCDILNSNSVASVNANIHGGSYNICRVGGLIGYATVGSESNLIKDCFYNGNITSIANAGNASVGENNKSNVGGLIGYSHKISIINCYAKGIINSNAKGKGNDNNSYVGGLIGYLYSSNESNISNSYTDISINSKTEHTTGATGKTNAYAGGLIGYIDPRGIINISDCYSIATLISTKNLSSDYNYAGGIVGYINKDSDSVTNSPNIKDCYASGSITATNGVAGGLISNKTSYTVLGTSYISNNQNITGSTIFTDTTNIILESDSNIWLWVKNNWDSTIWNLYDNAHPTLKWQS